MVGNEINSNGSAFLEHIESYRIPDYRLFFVLNFKEIKILEKLNIKRLKETLNYLESKHRDLKRQNENDTRSIESMIKYLKKDMLEQFKLSEHDILIKHEVKDTAIFIESVHNIIEANS
jgi:hypothetical protein